MSTLILYSSTDGHTLKICKFLAEKLGAAGEPVLLESISESNRPLSYFDKIVIGASIRYGKHRPAVYDYIKLNVSELNQKKSAFFSVNLVARKSEKSQVYTNPYMKKFLKNISWQPGLIKVFAGKLNYPQYGPLDKSVIRFIMWLTKGPTNPKTVIDYTDWDAITDLAEQIQRM